MQRYFGIAQATSGQIIPSCTVTVNLAGTSTAATLFSDDAYTPLANPFTSETDGTYQFYAQAGRYDVVLTKTGYTFDDDDTEDILLVDPMSIITPAQITSNQNNYNPTNGLNASIWRLSSDAARTITGIAAGHAGQSLIITNVGSFAITLSDQSASSTAANRIITGSGADVTLNAAGVAALVYDDDSSRWRATSVVAGSVASVFTMSPGTISGLEMANDATDPTNDITISVGAAASDDAALADRTAISIASALIKQSDANWAAGTNQGMLDTGVVGNNTYHIFAILNSGTGATDILSSTSASAPSMPAGYDKKRRIGSIIRSGGAILGFTQDANTFRLDASILDVDDAAPGTSAVTRTLTVPIGVEVEAIINVFQVGSASEPVFYMSPLDANDEAPSKTAAPLASGNPGAAAAYGDALQMTVKTNTSAQIRSRTSVNTNIRIATLGWIDQRGQG